MAHHGRCEEGTTDGTIRIGHACASKKDPQNQEASISLFTVGRYNSHKEGTTRVHVIEEGDNSTDLIAGGISSMDGNNDQRQASVRACMTRQDQPRHVQ